MYSTKISIKINENYKNIAGLDKTLIRKYDNAWVDDELLLDFISRLRVVPIMYTIGSLGEKGSCEKKIRIFNEYDGMIDTVAYEIYNKYNHSSINTDESINQISFDGKYILIPMGNDLEMKIMSTNPFITNDMYVRILKKLKEVPKPKVREQSFIA